MSQFIDIEDYDATVHREILDALVRDDESLVEICEDRAVAEMRGYLSNRYECDAIFSETGNGRNQLILMMALDISVYHIFCIHNPMKLSGVRKDRYERAVEWMKAVNKGQVNIDGAPMLPEDQLAANSPYLMKSNRKRINHY